MNTNFHIQQNISVIMYVYAQVVYAIIRVHNSLYIPPINLFIAVGKIISSNKLKIVYASSRRDFNMIVVWGKVIDKF